MNTAKLPAAIAAATGLTDAWISQCLIRLRQSGAIPAGRAPMLTSAHIPRVVLGLTASLVHQVPEHVRALEALPNRFVPADNGRTAGDALAALIDALLTGTVRPKGAIEINTTWHSIAIETVDMDGVPHRQEFGQGDHTTKQLLAAATTLPLVAVRSIAQALTSR
jgi:hypothetical protein